MDQIQPYRSQISERFPVASFHVRVPPERVFEVVCVTDPRLLQSEHRHLRTRANFCSSRASGLLRAPTGQATWLVDPNQLRRFAGARRLYYALATYGSPRGDDARFSSPLDDVGRVPGIDISSDFSGRSLDRARFGLPLDDDEEVYGRPSPQLLWGGDAEPPAAMAPSGGEGGSALEGAYDDGLDPALWAQEGEASPPPLESAYGQRAAGADGRITARVNACLEAFRRIPVDVGGSRVFVNPPYFIYRESPRLTSARQARSAATGATAALLREIGRTYPHTLTGKSTAVELADVLRRAVAASLFASRPDAAALRQWLVRYGIGVDCSGFVAQVLNDLVTMALGRAPTGADLLAIRGRNSASLRAGHQGFTNVARPLDVRPGDTMWKEGHIRIVSAVRVDGAAVELDTAESSSVGDIGPTPNTWRYPDGARFAGLQKRNGSAWRAAPETNVFSRYSPLERAMSGGTTAHGLDGAGYSSRGDDDDAPNASVPASGAYDYVAALAFAQLEPKYDDDVGEPRPQAEAEALIAHVFDAAAERANRTLALEVGWGRHQGAGLRILPALSARLGVPEAPTDVALATAVEAQQRALGIPVNGRLDLNTFRRLGVVPATRFAPLRVTVQHAGVTLGIWEKTTPYGRVDAGGRLGMSMNMGFRVTNPDAVRRAGFVLADGTPNFRVIQVIDFLRGVNTEGGRVSRLRAVDPTDGLYTPPIDPHPYYEDHLPGAPGAEIDSFRLQIGPNGLFYDLLFSDTPSAVRVISPTVQRRVRAFETAITGVAAGNRNTILSTVVWGYDILPTPELRTAALRPGTHGGSDAFRSVLSREARAGAFPGHCFVGAGFPAAIRCT